MVSKLLVLPLAFLFVVGAFNMFVHGAEPVATGVYLADSDATLYDRTSHAVCYGNGTAVSGGENGTLSVTTGSGGHTFYGWRNGTFGALYQLSSSAMPSLGLAWVYGNGGLGFVAIVGALMVVATLVGLRILGMWFLRCGMNRLLIIAFRIGLMLFRLC